MNTRKAPLALVLAFVGGLAAACDDDSPTSPTGQCGPYSSCMELRRDHPNGVPRSHCAYRPSLDRDNDGTACETVGDG